MSILNYNDKLFFMFDAIRRLILGMSAGIMGLAYLLITLLGFALKASGQWINSYTSYVWLYLILCVILWIIIVIFGATAAASSKDN